MKKLIILFSGYLMIPRSFSWFVVLLFSVLLVLYFGTGILSEVLFRRSYYLPPLEVNSEHKIIHETILSPEKIQEWKSALLNNKIISFRGAPLFDGLSEKFWVELEGGYLAVAKRVTPDMININTEFEELSYQDPKVPEIIYPRRAQRAYQGWNEVAASVIGDIVFPGMKLPSVLRPVSSSIVWSCPDYWNIRSFLKYYLIPEHEIYLSLTPYVELLTPWIPGTTYKLHLCDPESKEIVNDRVAGQISDLILFDFLVDDHDREKIRNWVLDVAGNIVFWDSGLAFSHGPGGRDSCLKLLCGPSKWKKYNIRPNTQPLDCTAICKFRNSTVNRLIELGPSAPKYNQLGERVRRELESSNAFRFGQYYGFDETAFPKFRYITDDFTVALDHRVVNLLGHISSCITEFGEDFVYSNFDQ